MIAAVLVSFQAADTDSAPWQSFVSKEGQFIVEFPTAPTSNSSKNENSPGGRMKVIVVACDTPSVVYIAEKITLPTAVVKGAEQNQLNITRDRLAQIYKGKVISEKRVRYEGSRPGLDFTIRAQPQCGLIVTLRVREYLAGQSIYVLIAGAAPNRELPAGAGRFFGSFTIGTVKKKKTGPKAEIEGKEIAGWGTAIDPDGDCKIAPDGKALVVEVPGKLHDLNADIDKFNAPRVLREVEGDFNIQVKVVGDFKPGAKSLNPKSVPFNGGGIFVWRDSDNYIRLERAAIIRGGKLEQLRGLRGARGWFARCPAQRAPHPWHGLPEDGAPWQPHRRLRQQGRQALDGTQADRYHLARRAQDRPQRHQFERCTLHRAVRGIRHQNTERLEAVMTVGPPDAWDRPWKRAQESLIGIGS